MKLKFRKNQEDDNLSVFSGEFHIGQIVFKTHHSFKPSKWTGQKLGWFFQEDELTQIAEKLKELDSKLSRERAFND